MIPIIDTHCHLYYQDESPRLDFSKDLDEVIARSKAAGVTYALLPNIDSESYPLMMALAERYPDYCRPMIGLHPTNVDARWESELRFVEEKLASSSESFIAIGEIGLDYHWSMEYQKEMQEVFRRQLDWAVQYHLPVSIHSRDAEEETIDLLATYQAQGLQGIVHSFGGDKRQLERVRDELPNFMVGVNGTLTFKNNPLASYLSCYPIERVVVETDAPFLAPVPYRGKRNEPAYLTKVVEKLQEVYALPEVAVRQHLFDDSKKIYNLHI